MIATWRGPSGSDRSFLDLHDLRFFALAAGLGLLDGHARHCMREGAHGGADEMTTEMMAAVGRLMKRG